MSVRVSVRVRVGVRSLAFFNCVIFVICNFVFILLKKILFGFQRFARGTVLPYGTERGEHPVSPYSPNCKGIRDVGW